MLTQVRMFLQHLVNMIVIFTWIIKMKKINEIKAISIQVGQTFTLSEDIGKFKKGEKVKVKEKKMYGDDIKLVLIDSQGVTDDFYLDKNDDFEQLD